MDPRTRFLPQRHTGGIATVSDDELIASFDSGDLDPVQLAATATEIVLRGLDAAWLRGDRPVRSRPEPGDRPIG